MKYFSLILSFVSLLFIAPLAQACPQGGGGNCNQTDAGSTQNTNQPSEESGNPINVVTGNKFQYETDYQAAGDLSALAFNRFYNSLNTDYDDGLGQGWSHSFELRMTLKPQKGIAQVIQSDGRRIIFKRQGTDGALYHGLSPQDGVINTLADGKVVWSLQDGRRIIFLHQKPIEIAFLGNKTLTLKYYQGHIRLVTDNHGRRLVFNYTQGNTALGSFAKAGDDNIKLAGHLESIELPDGEKIRYRYDNDLNLSQVIYPDNTSRIYHYENLEFPNHLTGITDRAGKRFATWAYDDEGRANLSQHAGGVEKVTLEYKIPEQAGDVGTTVVTNSLGKQSTYKWKFYPRISQSLLLSSEGPGCSTCPAPDKRYTYNNHYQLETATDTKTHAVTHYAYDKQGRTQQINLSTQNEDGSSTKRLIARYEYEGNLPKPTLIARESVNTGGEHTTQITYNDDQLPVEITEKSYNSVINDHNVTIEYKNGKVIKVDVVKNQKTQTTQIEYDNKNRLIKRSLSFGESLEILKRDKASRPSKVRLKRYANDTPKTYTFTYNWEGDPIEIAEGGRKILMEYNPKISSKTQKTSVYLPEKKNNTPVSTIAKKLINALSSPAYAVEPSKTSITGVYSQDKSITTLLEFDDIHRKVQKAETASLKSYLPTSLANNFTPIGQCTSNHVKCAELERGLKYAEVAKCAYILANCIGHDEWQSVSADELGVDNSLMFTGRYAAIVVKNKKTGEYVLSFRGTDDDIDGTDWWDNIAQGGFGATTGQYDKAMELARELDKKIPNLTVTGHSLGGGLATAAALAIKKEAVVFNPASLHPDFIKENDLDENKAEKLVTNYTIEGEILSSLQDKGAITIPSPIGNITIDAPSALGKRITLEPDNRWIYQQIGFTLPIEHAVKKGVLLHGMDGVQNTLSYQQGKLGCNSSQIN